MPTTMNDDPTQQSMRDFWDRKARENAMYYISSCRPYDDQDPEAFWAWGRTLAERFLAESGIAFSGEETMLEIGCGIGRMTAYFAERFRRVHGVDVSGEMIRRAGDNLGGVGNVTLSVGNGRDLSIYGDGAFDFVFSYITLQHVPDPRMTLNYIREVGRVLRPGGWCYVQLNNGRRGIRARLKLGTRLRRLLGREDRPAAPVAGRGPRELDHAAWQGSRLSIRAVRRACHQGNLRIERLSGVGTQYLWVKAVRGD